MHYLTEVDDEWFSKMIFNHWSQFIEILGNVESFNLQNAQLTS